MKYLLPSTLLAVSLAFSQPAEAITAKRLLHNVMKPVYCVGFTVGGFVVGHVVGPWIGAGMGLALWADLNQARNLELDYEEEQARKAKEAPETGKDISIIERKEVETVGEAL